MSEEKITLAIIKWLKESGFEVIAFDFPQSGTGVSLHPNSGLSKNLRTIIPDIIAKKNDCLFFFENKSFFSKKDFEKVEQLIQENAYSENLEKLKNKYTAKRCLFGIGGPNSETFLIQAMRFSKMTDFIVVVQESDNKISMPWGLEALNG